MPSEAKRRSTGSSSRFRCGSGRVGSAGGDDEGAGRTPRDPELGKLYRGLWASEHGHYRTFIQLAEQILPPGDVDVRWGQMLDGEAALIAAQPPGPRMHSGVGRA